MRLCEPGNNQRGKIIRMKGAASGALFFLVAILFPVLIWVALFVAVRAPLLRVLKRFGYAALFFLVAVSMSILVWIGLAVAMRKPLATVLRQIGTLALAIHESLVRDVRWLSLAWYRIAGPRKAMKPIAYVPLFLIAAVSMPVLVWVALAVVIRELSLRWRESRLPSAFVCRLDTDCPPGYVCLAGRCVPQY